MTHTQNTLESTLMQLKPCPLFSPLAVLGDGPTPILDRLTHEAVARRRDPLDTALECNWPDESDVDHRDDITIDRGEIYFHDESPVEVEPPIETAPPLVTSKGAIVFGACSLIILIVVGILFLIDPFGGAA